MILSMALWSYLVPGITFGFAAAAQPGPLSMYLVARTLQTGWKRTFPAIFVPLISDGPIAIVCMLILNNLPPGFLLYIQVSGGLFLLYLASRSAVAWKKSAKHASPEDGSSGSTIFNATVVNFLNPGPYLAWSLVIGPLFIKGWGENPLFGIALLAGFYLTMFFVTTLVILIFHQVRERGFRLQHAMIGLSAIFLALFGTYQLYGGIRAIME